MAKNRVTELFGIKYPLIQAGMIWCAPWQLAAAVSNAGGLGIIGSGSMYPDVLQEHIRKCKKATTKPYAVNLPLIYPQVKDHIEIILEEQVPVVFSSAGNPNTWTELLKDNGIKVVHVVPGEKFARKAEEAGADAVVAEGFEAGGHNGRDETTTFCLIPKVREAIDIPLIAAGGIGTGRGMFAAMALGAEGVQLGSRFVLSEESSAHPDFKNTVAATNEGDTLLALKDLVPVRLIKNEFFNKVKEAANRGASVEELKELLGHGRAKKGMFEGNLVDGELEIGQVAALFDEIKPAAQIVKDILSEYQQAKQEFMNDSFDFSE